LWLNTAKARVETDCPCSADTHLIAMMPLPGLLKDGIDLYQKDESTHPTGSMI
jgi:hypothetical protein